QVLPICGCGQVGNEWRAFRMAATARERRRPEQGGRKQQAMGVDFHVRKCRPLSLMPSLPRMLRVRFVRQYKNALPIQGGSTMQYLVADRAAIGSAAIDPRQVIAKGEMMVLEGPW